MWTRNQLKANAKYVLSFSYWKALLVCFVVSLISGIGSSGGSTGTLTLQAEQYVSNEILILMTVLILVIAAVCSLFVIFAVNPVEVGKNRFFIANRQNKGKFEQLFSIFRNGVYMNVVKTMFLMELKIFLWSLLFVIPGIIKTYEYLMVPYILAENPQIDSRRAFRMSRDMMKGEKWDAFVLELSFLGWMILGALACGIGSLFLAPYLQATFVELYEVLKYKVISGGQAHPDELGGPNGYTGDDYPAQPMPYAPVNYNPYPQQMPVQEPAAPQEEAKPDEQPSWFDQQIQAEQENVPEDKES